MRDLTLLIPVKNEVESLEVFLKLLDNFDYEKLLVIDCSDKNDYSNLLNKHKNCQSIKSSKTGYGQALIDGINSINTKYFCIINADGSMDPNELSGMLKLTHNCSFVFGTRYIKEAGSDDDTIITLIGNKFFSFFGKIFFNLHITDIIYT